MYVNHPIWPTKLQLTVTNTHSCVSQDFPLASASGIFSRPFFSMNLLQFSLESCNFSICLWWKISWGEIQLHICLQFKWWEHFVSANFLPVLHQITQLFIYLLGVSPTLVKRDKKGESFSKLELSLLNRLSNYMGVGGK